MIKEIKTFKTCIRVEVKREEGKYIKSSIYDFKNPIHVLKYIDKFEVEELSQILKAFDSIDFKYGVKEATHFNTPEEREEYINELDKGIDRYTIYIDDYRQMKSAEKWNKVTENEIKFVKKHGYSPAIMNKDGVRNYIDQAYGLIGGIEARNDKVAVSHLINWIKKMGYEKTLVNKESQTFHYELRFMLDNYNQYFESHFSFQKKKDGSYDVKFFYDYPTVEMVEEGLERNAYELDVDRGYYLYN